MRNVNSLSGRFPSIVAVIKSYPGLFLGFSEFIIDLISCFLKIRLMDSSVRLISCQISSEGFIGFGEKKFERWFGKNIRILDFSFSPVVV